MDKGRETQIVEHCEATGSTSLAISPEKQVFHPPPGSQQSVITGCRRKGLQSRMQAPFPLLLPGDISKQAKGTLHLQSTLQLQAHSLISFGPHVRKEHFGSLIAQFYQRRNIRPSYPHPKL